LAALLLSAGRALGTQLTPWSVEQLAEKAQLVLHGVVLSKSVQRDPAGRIFTRIELQITEAWKGKVDGDRFVLVQGGGTLGEETAIVSDQEPYNVGEEVVVFLVLNPRREGVTLGLAQGKFHVGTDPVSHEKLVHNIFHGRSPAARETLLPGGSRTPLSLAELKRRVQGGRL
jgi:hypothetical protein